MARPYIVVSATNAEITKIAIGMLRAQELELDYPMPGPTLYVWLGRPSSDMSQVAFGPIDEIDGSPDDGSWVLGQSIQTELGELTVPSEPQQLEQSWFWAPPIE